MVPNEEISCTGASKSVITWKDASFRILKALFRALICSTALETALYWGRIAREWQLSEHSTPRLQSSGND